MTDSGRGLSRRDFAKAAVAIGGASALSACLNRGGDEVDVPSGPTDLSGLPERQHAWNEFLARDDHGNAVMPRHHVLLLLDYADEGTPTAEERAGVEETFRALERAYARGNQGLLFAMAYSPYYFERFDASLPEGVDLPKPAALAPFEDPDADDPDALLHLASDHAQVVLGVEEALKGNRSSVNDEEVPDGLRDAFSVRTRRTGFIGAGLPAENDDVNGVPEGAVDEEAPLYMGFKSGFEKNQASEDRVTIESGPFAGGTTAHLSHISLHLDQWYEQDSRFQRVGKMFCPAHAENETVEGVGENLGDSSQLGECPAHAEEDARTSGMVGHSQKLGRARDGDDSPLILRRDFDSTDGGEAGLHFLSLQRGIGAFVETREAMNGTDLSEGSAVGTRTNNGILQYMTVNRRGNYLVPPRSQRSLPSLE